MTSAPPMPRSPAKNALRRPTPSSVDASASVTRFVWRARERSAPLPDARPVGGQVGELLVRDGLHERLYGLDCVVAWTPPIGLEEQHLVAQITRRLARQIGDALGRVALARGAMADGALRGRRAPALDRRRVELDRGRGARLTGEVRRDLVDAELHDHLRVGLHLGRRALAGRVVL